MGACLEVPSVPGDGPEAVSLLGKGLERNTPLVSHLSTLEESCDLGFLLKVQGAL